MLDKNTCMLVSTKQITNIITWSLIFPGFNHFKFGLITKIIPVYRLSDLPQSHTIFLIPTLDWVSFFHHANFKYKVFHHHGELGLVIIIN